MELKSVAELSLAVTLAALALLVSVPESILRAGLGLMIGLLGASIVLWSPIQGFYYRKPKLCRGWVIERQSSDITDGTYRLIVKLSRPPAESLASGSLRIHCNRAVFRAPFKTLIVKKKTGSEYESPTAGIPDHSGVVALTVPGIEAGRPFYFDGLLESDGPLKVYRVTYRPD